MNLILTEEEALILSKQLKWLVVESEFKDDEKEYELLSAINEKLLELIFHDL